MQSPLFHQYLYGAHAADCPLHAVGITAADLAAEAKRRRRSKPREAKEVKEVKEAKEVKEVKEVKEQTKRRKKKEETQPAGGEWAWEACLMRRAARGSLLTSFTDALPLLTSSSDHSSLTADSVFPPLSSKPPALPEATTSVGPSFSNYLQLFNSNGWLETDHPEAATAGTTAPASTAGATGTTGTTGVARDASIAFPSFTRSNFMNDAPVTPSFKPLPASNNSFFHSPPKFDVLPNEKSFRDVNSRVSNLFNRMNTSDGNSIPLTFSLTPLSPLVFNTKGNPFGEADHSFQKDTSLCFPISFDSKS